MNQQLITAIRERIEHGYSRESIKEAVMAAGHDEDTFARAYDAAEAERAESPANTETTTDEDAVARVAPEDESAPAAASQAATTATDSPATPGTTLIGVGTLVRESVVLGFTSIPTFLAFVIGLLLLLLVTVLPPGLLFAGLWWLDVPIAVVGISTALLLVLVTTLAPVVGASVSSAYLRAIIQRDAGVGFWESVPWALARIWPIFVIYLLFQLSVSGGSILLILPGLVLLIYIQFAYAAFVAEGWRGMAALQRSVHLVSGHFWGVVLRLLAFVGSGFVLGFLIGFLTDGSPLLAGALLLIVLLIFFPAGTAFYVRLFESLQTVRPKETFDQANFSKTRIVVYSLIVVFVVVQVVSVWFGYAQLAPLLQLLLAPNGLEGVPDGAAVSPLELPGL